MILLGELPDNEKKKVESTGVDAWIINKDVRVMFPLGEGREGGIVFNEFLFRGKMSRLGLSARIRF